MQHDIYFGNPAKASIYLTEEMGNHLNLPDLADVPTGREPMSAEHLALCRVNLDWSPQTRELLITSAVNNEGESTFNVRRNIGEGLWKNRRNVWVIAAGKNLVGLEDFNATYVPVSVKHNGLLVQLPEAGTLTPYKPRTKKGVVEEAEIEAEQTPAQRFSAARREFNAALADLVSVGGHHGFTFKWITGSETVIIDARGSVVATRTIEEEL